MRNFLLAVLFLFLLTGAGFAGAQQQVYRIASINTSASFEDSFRGFKARMQELGYREGKNVRYDFYDTRGDGELLMRVAGRLVKDKVNMIVTSSTTATVAAAKATAGTNLPVVFLSAGNPQRLVKSFASSGSNLAGISSGTLELTGKRFELLREMVPAARRVARFSNPRGVNYAFSNAEVVDAAKKLGFTLTDLVVTNRSEIRDQTESLRAGKVDAVFTPPDALITGAIDVIVERSLVEKLPLITSLLANVRRGCLATYAANYVALGRQGADLVDKILKGAKPADLPIEQPMSFSLVINLKTAKAIGLKVPAPLLLRADEVIE